MDREIAALRERFESELLLQQNSQTPDRFHPIDINRVRTEDWQVRRYILDEEEGDLEAAYSALIRTLEWKQKWGVHENHLGRYPKEIFDLYSMELFEYEKGRYVFSEAMRGQRHYPELEQIARDFVVAWAEHVDRTVGEQGHLTYLMDFTGSSLLKLDLGLTRFRIGVFSRHYPRLLGRCLLHRVPKVVRAPLKMAISQFFKQAVREAVTYTSGKEELFGCVDPVRLHVDYGGLRKERVYPVEGLESAWTLYPKLGLERKFVESFLKETQIICKKELAYNENDDDEK